MRGSHKIQSDNNDTSVQLQLQLPTGIELGNKVRSEYNTDMVKIFKSTGNSKLTQLEAVLKLFRVNEGESQDIK